MHSLADKFYDGMTFKYRKDWGNADLMVFEGVIKNDEYMVNDLPIPIKTCVDIGANIGAFGIRLWKRQPDCKIALVEVDIDNIDLLHTNIANRPGQVFNVACHYGDDLKLYSSVFEGTACTGGSMVVEGDQSTEDPNYRLKDMPEIVTLEWILDAMEWDSLDLLKLDCEGSEHSILQEATCLDKVGLIIGEWHGNSRFQESIKHFENKDRWHLDYLNCEPDEEQGVFRLCQKDWWNMEHKKVNADSPN